MQVDKYLKAIAFPFLLAVVVLCTPLLWWVQVKDVYKRYDDIRKSKEREV